MKLIKLMVLISIIVIDGAIVYVMITDFVWELLMIAIMASVATLLGIKLLKTEI